MSKEETPRISVVINAHAEDPFWLRRAIASVEKQVDPPDFEIIVVADRAAEDTRIALGEFQRGELGVPFGKWADCIEHVDFGDLGMARNHGVSLARGKYIAFLDGDDAFGCRWLRQAYECARESKLENFVLHPEYNVFFGAQNFLHQHVGDDDPEFDAKDQLQFNQWSALAFAPREMFERFPYRRADRGLGYEDFMFNTETLGAGVKHRVVPASCHFVRMKLDQSSMATRYVQTHRVIPRMALYDRRDLPNATQDRPQRRALPNEVLQQTIFAHRYVGERQILLTREMEIRRYPRQTLWNDQAWIRDAIGDAKHVVLVDNLHQGGAEKYAIDWAKAVGAVIVETSPGPTGVWREKAAAEGVRVVTWMHQQKDLNDMAQSMAVQRALIQCELTSLLVCNSRIGWILAHQNAEPLAKNVYCASFATIPVGGGMESCPPFFIKNMPPNMRIITDNEAHAKRMRDYNAIEAIVLQPKCSYDGPSKRSQIAKKHLRVLWAGRGTPEKNPGILPTIASLLEDKADIHVWGDVQPMNAPENLKFRGPFDGFASIDGSYDVYLMTSLTEGMPNTAMEAVMADIPVVGPEVGGLPDLVSMHYRGDATAIVQAILHASEKYTAAPKLLVTKWRDEFDDRARMIANPTLKIDRKSVV